MVKVPRPGRVKTRLGRDIGMVPAAWWFRHQVARLLRRLEDRRWRLVLAVAPDAEGMASRVWPAHLERWPQGRGDLGARMVRMMRRAGPGPVLVIGADIPGVTKLHIATAFAALRRARAGFGPAPDGGYWAVGLGRGGQVCAGFLSGVRWSTCHALADSIASLRGEAAVLVDTLRDVDEVGDL